MPINKEFRKSFLLVIVVLLLASVTPAQQQNVATAIDEMLQKEFKANEPGAAVIVVKDDKTLFRKGYGMANLELGVAVEPDMIFRIGSITKQFTAVAILMLAEQGKLALTDEITKFLPEYPTQGKKITVEHLLNHTSGIKSYTSLPEWLPLWRKDMSLDELFAIFKDKPMDFVPGDSWSYNNSAYVMLGAIIEKASGQSYKDFIEKRIFEPLGMKHSFYDSTSAIMPRRVSGYSRGKDGFVNCAYLSMSQPHAAGSLVSSVDDLALWDAALYTDKLLKPESLKRAWTPARLNDGRMTHYGYGWAMNEYEGHRMISHGGGINGFTTHARRLPDDRLFVSVLTNRDTGNPNPEMLTKKIAALIIGKPYRAPVAITLPVATLDSYVGEYEVSEKEKVKISREENKLMLSMGAAKVEILSSSETEFFSPAGRFTFIKEGGKVTAMIWHNDYGLDQKAKRKEQP